MTEYTVKVNSNGTRFWYLNDQLHCTDGPAIEWPGGTRMWYFNGERHRTDGPAIEWASGEREWYLNGEELTEAEFRIRPKLNPTS